MSIYGSFRYLHMGYKKSDNWQMDIARVIAHNLSTWMEASTNLNTLKALSKASGVGFGTVQRAKNGDGNITVQNLEAIAHAFKRKAVDLLADPGLEYSIEPVVNLHFAQEPPVDEYEILQGYRDASPDVREVMRVVARSIIKKRPMQY